MRYTCYVIREPGAALALRVDWSREDRTFEVLATRGWKPIDGYLVAEGRSTPEKFLEGLHAEFGRENVSVHSHGAGCEVRRVNRRTGVGCSDMREVGDSED